MLGIKRGISDLDDVEEPIRKRKKSNNEVYIDIIPGSLVYHNVLKYCATFKEITTFSCGKINRDDYDEENEESYETELHISHGTHVVEYKGKMVTVEYLEWGEPIAMSFKTAYHETLTISTDDDVELLKSFLLAANDYCKVKRDRSYVNIMIYKGTYWSHLSKLPIRDIDTVFLDKEVKDKIIADINKFVESEEVYKQFGLPYKRTYLFEGIPGTGKTSLIFAIASMLNMNISIISFGAKMDDEKFMAAISSMENNNVLLIEDIDTLFQNRRSENKSSVTFSAILNTLDGIGRKNKMITFITTNFVDRLDRALVRAGRIDYTITFTHASKEQIREMFMVYFPDQVDDFGRFYKKIKRWKITTACLQKFFFDNREDQKIIEQIDKLKELVDIYNSEPPPGLFT